MSTDVNVFENESTVDKVVQAMSDCDVDYVIVVQSRKPTGIITERDVIVRMQYRHYINPSRYPLRLRSRTIERSPQSH